MQRPHAAQSDFPGRGGIPMLADGEYAGAVGVSGASPEVDDAIAREGILSLAG